METADAREQKSIGFEVDLVRGCIRMEGPMKHHSSYKKLNDTPLSIKQRSQ